MDKKQNFFTCNYCDTVTNHESDGKKKWRPRFCIGNIGLILVMAYIVVMEIMR